MVSTLTIFTLNWIHTEVHLFLQSAAEEATDGVGLPAGLLPQFREEGADRPLEQAENLSRFCAGLAAKAFWEVLVSFLRRPSWFRSAFGRAVAEFGCVRFQGILWSGRIRCPSWDKVSHIVGYFSCGRCRVHHIHHSIRDRKHENSVVSVILCKRFAD